MKLIFALAVALLSIWAIIGSYKNASYLNQIYLLDVQVTGLNLSAIFDVNNLSKRDGISLNGLEMYNNDIVKRNDIVERSDVAQIIQQIVSKFNYSDLGIADAYTISYWGYCRGQVTSQEEYDKDLDKYMKPFNNKKLNITWCSDPVVGYKPDPINIMRTEINNTINSYLSSVIPSQYSTLVTDLETLLENLTSNDDLKLPGNLNNLLNLVHSLTVASFAFLLVSAILAVLSVFFQLISCFANFDSCLLSCISFFYYTLIFITSLLGAALYTGAYLETRKQFNNNVSQYGMKSYLSISFTAFIWAAFVAALLMLIISIIGHCLSGLFGRRRSEPMAQLVDDEMKYEPLTYEPLMAYEGR